MSMRTASPLHRAHDMTFVPSRGLGDHTVRTTRLEP